MDGEKLVFQQNTEHLGETHLFFYIPYETLTGALNHFISLSCQTMHKRREVNQEQKSILCHRFFHCLCFTMVT